MSGEDTEGPRHRRHRANLERIVDAASRVVFEEGLDALSVKRVADLADYTPGALYRYFSSKDALLVAVVVRLVEGLGSRVRASQEGVPEPLTRVVRAARAYREFAKDEPHAFALLASMIADPRWVVGDDDAALAILQAAIEVALPLTTALSDATDAGILTTGEGEPRALALFATLQGSMLLRKYERRFPMLAAPDAVFDTALGAVLRGYGASEAAVTAAFAL